MVRIKIIFNVQFRSDSRRFACTACRLYFENAKLVSSHAKRQRCGGVAESIDEVSNKNGDLFLKSTLINANFTATNGRRIKDEPSSPSIVSIDYSETGNTTDPKWKSSATKHKKGK